MTSPFEALIEARSFVASAESTTTKRPSLRVSFVNRFHAFVGTDATSLLARARVCEQPSRMNVPPSGYFNHVV